jgi:hypothetical protein
MRRPPAVPVLPVRVSITNDRSTLQHAACSAVHPSLFAETPRPLPVRAGCAVASLSNCSFHSQAGLASGASVMAVLALGDLVGPQRAPVASVADSLSEAHMQVLFDLLKCGATGLVEHVWRLLQLVPTSSTLRRRCRDPAAVNWGDVVPASLPYFETQQPAQQRLAAGEAAVGGAAGDGSCSSRVALKKKKQKIHFIFLNKIICSQKWRLMNPFLLRIEAFFIRRADENKSFVFILFQGRRARSRSSGGARWRPGRSFALCTHCRYAMGLSHAVGCREVKRVKRVHTPPHPRSW